MTAKEPDKLNQRIARRIASQGASRSPINNTGIIYDCAFYRDAKDIRSRFPNCKIIRSHKMTRAEMEFFCTI